MSFRTTLSAAVLAVFALGSAGTGALAADAKKPMNMDRAKPGAQSESASAAQAVATAYALARYGDANKDALSLITAARMLKAAGTQLDAVKPNTPPKEGPKVADDKLTVDAILARARALAGSRADLLALADDVAKSGARGVESGPKVARGKVVGSRAAHYYDLRFSGGEPARVYARGDGDSDLDMYVYDEAGNLICKDDDGTDEMACGWTPRWSGYFRIRIVNRGIANQYDIITN